MCVGGVCVSLSERPCEKVVLVGLYVRLPPVGVSDVHAGPIGGCLCLCPFMHLSVCMLFVLYRSLGRCVSQ